MSATGDRPFEYRRVGKSAEQLSCDKVSLSDLAHKFGTPLYVYSATYIRERYRAFEQAFAKVPHTICYSVKANSNLSILRMLSKLGSSFDVVSGGELERVGVLGARAAKRVVFSGVGKTAAEMDAAIKSQILIFNIESAGEIKLLAERAARAKKKVRVALRVNPDVFAETHPYISTGLREHKFGVDIRIAPQLYREVAGNKYLEVAGVSVHIGSQITSTDPFAAAMERVADLVRQLTGEGHKIRYVDAGGGLGIAYHPVSQFDFADRVKHYAQAITSALEPLHVHLLLEPGRAIIGPAGALLTRVLYNKRNGSKRFLIVDAGMNDLIRPSLYKAHHEIVPVEKPGGDATDKFDIVGPVCETGDFFAHDRDLPEVAEGALVAILDTGAYGFSITSNYNSRPRPAEVLVEDKSAKLIRKRETMEYLLRPEL